MSAISPMITVATLGRVWAVAPDLGVNTVLEGPVGGIVVGWVLVGWVLVGWVLVGWATVILP